MDGTRFISIYKDWYTEGYNYIGGGYRKNAPQHDLILARSIECAEIKSLMDEVFDRYQNEGYTIYDKKSIEGELWFNSILMKRWCYSEKSDIRIDVYNSEDDYKKANNIS